MLVTFSASHRDFELCSDLLDWVKELGPYPQHKALLVCSSQIASPQSLLAKLNQCGFGQVHGVKQREVEESGWPLSCNKMFQLAAEFVEQKAHEPFLWMESDATPLREGWLDSIDAEYKRWNRPFMGVVFDWISAVSRRPHLTGNAVYPPNIRRFNPHVLLATAEPWDVTRPELTLRHTHQTRLIQHVWGDRQTNDAPTFPDEASLSIIQNDAVIFHRCKNGSLIERLRDARNATKVEDNVVNHVNHSKPAHITLLSTVKHKLAAMINGASTYSHAGNIGDVIYGLAAIKAAGGGDLVICPEQRKTAICSIPISHEQFRLIEPLLKHQSYLRNVSFSSTYPTKVVHDLNTFRNAWVDHQLKQREGLTTLCKAHFYTLGMLHRFEDAETWLQVSNPIDTDKIIVHRSPRYNSATFPWKRLVEQRGKDLLFVGLEHEKEKFERDFGAKVSFWRISDFLELARLIAGSRCFVGNQSSPLSIAIGLGHPVICEECERSPDCRFNRTNYTGHLEIGPNKIDFEAL